MAKTPSFYPQHYLLLITFLVVYFAAAITTPENVSSHGEKCDEQQICDTTKNLECVNDICQCAFPEAMIFRNDTCSVTLNSTCFLQDSSSTPINSNNATGGDDRTLPCGQNAVCDRLLKICVCEEHFVEQSGDVCVAKKQLGENCTTSSDCREDSGITCEDNVCICDPKTTIYSRVENTCVGLAEMPCVKNSCTANARCINLDDEDSESSSGKICDCMENYDPTPLGTCAKYYGISCEKNTSAKGRHCKPWLRCGPSGTCECPNATYQFYDENANACLSKVNGPCIPFGEETLNGPGEEKNEMTCGNGADCVLNDDLEDIGNHGPTIQNSSTTPWKYHCMCRAGYEATEEGKCELGYGSRCRNNIEPTDKNIPCNRDANLECVEGKCECNAEYKYCKDRKTCFGRAGALCHIERLLVPIDTNVNESTHVTKSSTPKLIGCVSGATCEPDESPIKQISYGETRDSLFAYGKCQCTGKELDDNTCEVVAPLSACPIIIVGSVVFICGLFTTLGYLVFKKVGFMAEAITP